MVAFNIIDDKQKHALLLYQAGQETQEIFDALTEMGEHYKTALTKLRADHYFLPKKVVNFFQFQQSSRKINETVLDHYFVIHLHKLAIECEFADLDRDLKSAVFLNC